MANPRKSLQGKTFGHLKVVAPAGQNEHGNSIWECQCRCGQTKVVLYQHLTTGGTTSCGCMRGKWKRPTKK